MGLHHPAVLTDGGDATLLLYIILKKNRHPHLSVTFGWDQLSTQVYILGAGLVLASLLTIPPWGIYRLDIFLCTFDPYL